MAAVSLTSRGGGSQSLPEPSECVQADFQQSSRTKPWLHYESLRGATYPSGTFRALQGFLDFLVCQLLLVGFFLLFILLLKEILASFANLRGKS